MLPLCKYVGFPVTVSGSVVLVVRLSDVDYPNVFINRSRKDPQSPLLFCSPHSWATLYEPQTYDRIPLITTCPDATFLCQFTCTMTRQQCRPLGMR